jgi:hypothetical protein
LGLLPSPPDLRFPRDGHDIGVGLLFQPPPQSPIIALDGIACHPRGKLPHIEGPLEHLTRQVRCRGKQLLGGYPSVRATRTIVCPYFRKRV